MFLRLYLFLRGYLTLEVKSAQTARFINLAANKGIYIWNVCQIDGRTYFCVSIKAFRLLRIPAKKSGSRLKIAKKSGLPFILHRYTKRKAYLLGIALFAAMLLYLTSFIWLVTIDGNDIIEDAELQARLRGLGVAPGLHKRGLDAREIEEELMAAFPNLSFANLQIRGTRAAVSVVETIRPQAHVDPGIPSDIIAARDGIIVEVATTAGRPLVRPGDVVSAGDVLVSGELRVGVDDYSYQSYFVHAEGRVTARRYHEHIIHIPLTYTVKNFTGNVMRNYGIILFEQKVYLRNAASPFTNYEMTTEINRMSFGADYPLPVAYFTESFREFVPTETRRSFEEAEIMGRTVLDSRLMRELPEDSQVLAIDIAVEEVNDVLVITAHVAVVEAIGENREIEDKDLGSPSSSELESDT